MPPLRALIPPAAALLALAACAELSGGEQRFGLARETRVVLYEQVVRAEQLARCQAEDAVAPLAAGAAGDAERERAERVEALREEYLEAMRGEILFRYEVTEAQIDSVAQEGAAAGWERPPAPC